MQYNSSWLNNDGQAGSEDATCIKHSHSIVLCLYLYWITIDDL